MTINTLTYRERFTRTLAHQSVDRPPMDLGSTDMTEIEGGPRVLAPILGLTTDLPEAVLDETVLMALDTDIRGVGHILTPGSILARRISDSEYIDAWGIRSQFNGHHFEMVGRPLADATLDDLEKFPWPDPEQISAELIASIRERTRYLYEETPYVVCARHPYFGVLELGCWMCGFDDFLYRLAGEPEFVQRFFEIILNYQRRVDELYYAAVGRFIHFTTSGDDFGTQLAPFLSPAMFREFIAPCLKARIDHIHTFTDAPFFHHSCGAIYPLIPDLINSGVEILNPIQPRAANMEPERLKHDFGDKLTFYGGVDTQELLPNGTPEQVYEETKRLIDILAQDGGYILSAAHVFQHDVPKENIVAMYRAGVDTPGTPIS